MSKKEKIINKLIQERKSIYPASYIDKSIDKDIIEQILKNADRAPNHRHTEPWRFKVIKGDKKAAFETFMAQTYEEVTPSEKFSPMKQKKIKKKITASDTIILICMQRDEAQSVPAWEEVAATAMAVQNMYLTCTAYEIGCYWSSPKAIIEQMRKFCPMKKGEICLGILYMGYYDGDLNTTPRKPLKEKVVYL